MSLMSKFSYGLYLLTSSENGKDNGCIINTAIQAAASPLQVSICVSKDNYSCGIIERTGKFAVSILTEDAPFELFQRFGFQCGKDVDKFDGFDKTAKMDSGLIYLNEYSAGAVYVEVTDTVDLGSHMMFVGRVAEEKELSGGNPLTYQYYFDHIKPAPTGKPKAKGYVCKICGYIYEGDPLPADFICPLCKHGAEDFEPIG